MKCFATIEARAFFLSAACALIISKRCLDTIRYERNMRPPWLTSTDERRVQIYCILDDTSRDSQGNVLGFDHNYQQAAPN